MLVCVAPASAVTHRYKHVSTNAWVLHPSDCIPVMSWNSGPPTVNWSCVDRASKDMRNPITYRSALKAMMSMRDERVGYISTQPTDQLEK
jgi:hypothetical protein